MYVGGFSIGIHTAFYAVLKYSQHISSVEGSGLQNYPNPFNPSTSISYQLPQQSHVTLKVFDVLGREVATLVNEAKQPGTNTVQFNASGLTSGVYFYRLQAGGFSKTRKLIVLK